MRPHIVKTIQGHIRPYKANTAIQYPNVPQKHIFLPLDNFSLMFPRQEQEQQQQSFFKDLWALLAVIKVRISKWSLEKISYFWSDSHTMADLRSLCWNRHKICKNSPNPQNYVQFIFVVALLLAQSRFAMNHLIDCNRKLERICQYLS